MITLRQPLTLEECQQVRIWRNAPEVLPMLRTGYKTEAEQAEFYRHVIAPSFWRRVLNVLLWRPHHEYFAIEYYGVFVGMGGLTYISRWNGRAEISLILAPNRRGDGLGWDAVDLLLAEAWRRGLTSVKGECYKQGAVRFWAKQIARQPAHMQWTWERPA